MSEYDVNDLISRLKDQGLDVAEDAAKLVVGAVFAWVKDSALASENKMDDLVLAVLPVVEEYVLSQLDKLDGRVG